MTTLKKYYPLAIAAFSLMPFVAGAQALDTIISRVSGTLNTIIGVLFVVATIVFLWGVISFIANSADEAKRNKAKAIMTWGIIGLAVMAAVWGIVQVLVQYFNVGGQGIPGGPRSQ